MKNQALFSAKDKTKKIKCGLLQFLFGVLRVKITSMLSGEATLPIYFCFLNDMEQFFSFNS